MDTTNRDIAMLREYIAALEKIILDESCGRKCCACDTVVSIDDSFEVYTDRDVVAYCRQCAPVWAKL